MASTSTSSPDFQSIFDAALCDYSRQTGINLATYPASGPFALAQDLQDCHSADDLLRVLQDKSKQLQAHRDGNRKLVKCLKPIVHVLHTLSGVLPEATAPAPFPPTKAIILGIDVLLAAAIGVSASYDAMVDLFECVGSFLDRLRIYAGIPFSPSMSNIVIKIMAEVLSILSLATKQIKEGRLKKFSKKLLGESEIEDVLRRLDRLTHDEARMTGVQTLQVVHDLVTNMKLVMDDSKASMGGIQQALVTLQETANEINKMKRDQLQEKVRNWLSPPDPSENYNAARDAHYGETSAWFIQGRTFKEWQETGPLLWIHGKPGSGKTIFCSTIIQEVKAKCDRGLALMGYYYFDSNNIAKQRIRGVLTSLLSQLSAKSDPCYHVLSGLYLENNAGSQQPSNDALTECLKNILRLPRQPMKYIILDALDECPNTSGFPTAREEVMDLVEDIVKLNLQDLHVCVTSRPEIDIQNALEPLTSLHMSLHDQSGQRQDILDYIRGTVHSDRKMRRWRPEDKQLVIDTLSSKADGMFRWVYCQLETLRRCFPTVILRTLNELPETLDETYERTLLGIEKEKREFAHRLFQCLIATIRPLHIDELATVLAIRFDSGDFPHYHMDWRSEDSREAVLSACSSLITVVNAGGSPVVQFSHFSVKEFLTSDRLAKSGENLSRFYVLPKSAHTILAQASLSVLFSIGSDVDKQRIEQIPFARYAAQHWVDHGRFEDVSSSLRDAMERLFDPAEPLFSLWIWIYDIDLPFRDHMVEAHPPKPEASPLYYATLCGFHDLVEHLISAHPGDVNVQGGHRGSPLNAALAKGNVEIAVKLLHCGASLRTKNVFGDTALHQASQVGRRDVVELLLEHHANVDIRNLDNETPLMVASREGAVDIARTLLQCGAAVDTRDKKGRTPFSSASRYGHLEIVRLLIQSGAAVDSPDNDGWTPLIAASQYGHLEVVRLLIQSGAAVDPPDNDGRTPLSAASAHGHLEIVRLLIQSGADVDSPNEYGWTPLFAASTYGCLDVVRLLIQSGAVVDSPDNNGRTPLSAASAHGHLGIVRLLIQSGAVIDSPDYDGWTPLFIASSSGNLDIVQDLLGHHADVNARSVDLWSPLHVSSAFGHLHIVKLLIHHGADVDQRSKNQETPLHLASRRGQLDVSCWLVERGSSTNSKDCKGSTPLHGAACGGYHDIVTLLLESGADPNMKDNDNKTPLDLASSNENHNVAMSLAKQIGMDLRHGIGIAALDTKSPSTQARLVQSSLDRGEGASAPCRREKTSLCAASGGGDLDSVRLLIDHGADPNERDEFYGTPLHVSSEMGRLDITEVLIDHGANVNLRNKAGWTALHIASRHGHLNVARLLVACGAELNAKQQRLWTPLHLASVGGNFEIARLLLDRGANVDARNEDGRTACQLALREGMWEVVQLFSEYGVRAD